MGQGLLSVNFWTQPTNDAAILITIEYDGGPFVGWQRQKMGRVFKRQSNAAKAFIHEPVTVVGAGGPMQVCMLSVRQLLMCQKNLTRTGNKALNVSVPITIQSASEVPGIFMHASAIGGTISTVFYNKTATCIDAGRVWHHKQA